MEGFEEESVVVVSRMWKMLDGERRAGEDLGRQYIVRGKQSIRDVIRGTKGENMLG